MPAWKAAPQRLRSAGSRRNFEAGPRFTGSVRASEAVLPANIDDGFDAAQDTWDWLLTRSREEGPPIPRFRFDAPRRGVAGLSRKVLPTYRGSGRSVP